jgi:hypothetical protein
MTILSYKLDTTNDLLTSRAGLLSIAQLMNSLKFSERIDHHFPLPGSNRGFLPSQFIKTLILMQHEGSFHLDDVRNIDEDAALRAVLNLKTLPKSTTLGDWLRRLGEHAGIQDAWVNVNQAVLKSALHRRKEVTLDIDATEIVSDKSEARWTYNKNKGFMPMVGHIAETGHVVAIDFRKGNVPPAQDNLAFIEQCQQSLPEGCTVNRLRIDAAGYQTKIIEYCDKHDISYAIRAKTSDSMRAQIKAMRESDWQPLINKQGLSVVGQDTCRTSFCIGDYENAFTLVIQRKAIEGQASLDLETEPNSESLSSGGYVYRAIASNRDELTDSDLIHWYNQRAEDSENRIKELKLDFGGGTLPCSSFNANALYFLISALSYNLFALMKQLLPERLARHRAITIRWRLYAMAAKVVRTGREMFVKLQQKNKVLLEEVLIALRAFDPPPI